MKINRDTLENSKLVKFFKKYWIGVVAVIVVIAVIISSVGIYREEVLHIDPNVEYEDGDKLYFASNALDRYCRSGSNNRQHKSFHIFTYHSGGYIISERRGILWITEK